MNLSLARYEANVSRLRSRVISATGMLWGSMRSYRDVDVDRFVARAVPMVQAGQLQVAGMTAMYQGTALGVATTVNREAVLNVRGVDPYEVYRRPAVDVYTRLSQGSSLQSAVRAGAARLGWLAAMDLQLAKTHQARDTIMRSDRDYFRRVLTGKENCALCVVASTQRYNRDDLMPIHPGCDCNIETIPKGSPMPDPVLDQELLDRTYEEIATKLDHVKVGLDAHHLGLDKADAKGRPLSDYTDLIVTRNHGEYGPTLAWRDHKFTSAVDIAALA